MKTRQIPPLKALLAFEAAAEAGSFAAAAERLFVTPAAVSQQIKVLEQQLDIRLFERSKSGVRLTRAGQSYLVFIREALEKLRLGQQQIELFRRVDVLTITALPSLASNWLMPLVLQWMELNPGLQVRVEASHARVDFNRSVSDICIGYGESGYAGLNKELLFTDSVSMVLSPQLLATVAEPQSLEAITQLPRIHIDWGEDNDSLPDWEDWLQAAGLDIATSKAGPRFNLSSMAIDAAVQGKGLLLGQRMLIADELKAGRLVAPCEISLPLGRAYYLVYPKRTLDNANARRFIDWLLASF
ncbi:LysR family transcriptional regulator [Motiliproteus coralliicola]|uniref:LysR family transcriptional regulator n=1 Tax=Motiliproteus coralliicola TaxID=2283196 RepID=A0A369WUM6_9GAMM|nr:LysR substrate-binding domain-containing protein [Motiliproteus coralliicola]RDE25362.1 LysR family transcriptional regulator [Motiliproteus coralliicola]